VTRCLAAPVECEVPADSALRPSLLAAAWFSDAYRAPLQAPAPGVIDLFFGIFGHHPRWIKAALMFRNRLARFCGLRVAADSDILAPARRASYQVGDTIGPWPIFSLSDEELIAGRNNAHLDFRLSIFRDVDGPVPSVVVSTVCIVHHWTGKAYLLLVVPFHRWGVRHIIARALRAGRL
jgi:Protein of unknown function (DUF2867)